MTMGLVFFDQVINSFVEIFYQELGVRHSFSIWWCDHLFGNIFVFILLNLYILHDTRANFPEFYGWKGRRYPDTPIPRWPLPRPVEDEERDLGELSFPWENYIYL